MPPVFILITDFDEVIGFNFHSTDMSSQNTPILSGSFTLKWGQLFQDFLLFTEYVIALCIVLV